MVLRLEGNHRRLNELRPLLQRVSDSAGIEPAQLAVFFDTADYACDASVDDHFRKPAGHFVCTGVVPEGVPASVRPLMADPACRYVIWLSKPLLDEDVEQVLWVFAHEYRHFMHRTGIVDANEIACSLMVIHQNEGTTTRFANLDRPEELDCELFAYEILNTILGTKAVDWFIDRRCADPQGAAYYQRLRYLAGEVKASNPSMQVTPASGRA